MNIDSFSDSVYNEMENSLNTICVNETDTLQRLKLSSRITLNSIERLKKFIDDYDFIGAGDEINFFGARMKMFERAAANGNACFGEALIANGGISMREKFTDFRPVFRRENGNVAQIFNVHSEKFSRMIDKSSRNSCR